MGRSFFSVLTQTHSKKQYHLVIKEYDKRHLAANVRYRALDDFEDFLKRECPELLSDVSRFPTQKVLIKRIYEIDRNDRDLKLSAGASSMINELYNQLNAAKITLTDYLKQ